MQKKRALCKAYQFNFLFAKFKPLKTFPLVLKIEN